MGAGPLFETISSIYQPNLGPAVATVPKPAGLVEGELMVVMGWLNTGLVSTVNFPAGWTKIRQDEPGIGNPKGFLGFKFADAADVAASSFIFSHSEGSGREWFVAIYRVSGAGGIDNERMLLLNNILIGTQIVLLPALDTIADNVLMLRGLGIDTTGVEATSYIDPGTDTRRAIEGGHLEAGASNGAGLWYTLNASPVSPPQTIVSAPVTMVGASGNKRSVQYAIGICPPTVFGSIEEAEARAREKQEDGTWVVAHSQITNVGNPAVRAQRFMSPADPGAGAWVDIVDSTVV